MYINFYIAWILGNRPVELKGYDHIGIQYFYLGNKEKAKYYHERMIYGLYEKDTKIKESNATICPPMFFIANEADRPPSSL